jgi:hypothetical protein
MPAATMVPSVTSGAIARKSMSIRLLLLHRRRWIAFWLFVAFSATYIAVTRGHFISTDEIII